MGPPNAMLDYHSTADEMSASYTSNGTALHVLNNLANLSLLLIVIQNIGLLLDIDLGNILNFIRFVYHTLLTWISHLRHHVFTVHDMRNLPTRILNIFARLGTSTITGVRTFPGTIATAWTLLPWLTRILSHTVRRAESITVSTLVLPGRGTVAVIYNLPSDVSAPEVRRFLETALWTQYRHSVRSECSGTHAPVNAISGTVDAADNSDELANDTSRQGLWRGTCIRGTPGLIAMPSSSLASSTPDHSGPNTPNSSTSGRDFSTSESASGSSSGSPSGSPSDLLANSAERAVADPTGSEPTSLADLAPSAPRQRRSTSRRA